MDGPLINTGGPPLTYAKITNAVPYFRGLCRGPPTVPLMRISRKAVFLVPKIRVMRGPSVGLDHCSFIRKE